MTESRHRTNCDGPLSCGGEGQAVPDAITYARKARISLGATRRRTKQEDAMRGPWRRLKSQFSRPSNRIIRVTLFLEPRNHARRCRAYLSLKAAYEAECERQERLLRHEREITKAKAVAFEALAGARADMDQQ